MRRSGILVGLVAGVLGVGALGPAVASAMTVTSPGETGTCTLRAAIDAVNTNNSGTPCGVVNPGGPTTIDLPAGTYAITAGQLQVASGANIEIVGANTGIAGLTVIDAGGASRVFEVFPGGSLKLVGLTVTGGQTAAGSPAATIFVANPGGRGGGILNRGTLVLDRVAVSGNATGGGGRGANGNLQQRGGPGGEGGPGGGIYNDTGASLQISHSTITGNATGNGGNGGDGGGGLNGAGNFPDGSAGGDGAWAGDGGGIYNAGTATITNSTISDNHTGRGGAGGSGGQGAGPADPFQAGKGGDGGDGGNGGRQWRKDQGTYWDSERGGGGIYNARTLTITSSTISGNSTGAGGLGGTSGAGSQNTNGAFRSSGRAGSGGGAGRGGGLLSGGGGITAQTPLTMTNVTIHGNWTGTGGTGGSGGGAASASLGGGVGGWGGNGGGFWGQGARNGSAANLTNVTLTANSVGPGGPAGSTPNPALTGTPGGRGAGAGIAAGGRYNPTGSGIFLKNTIVAGNGNPGFGDENCASAASPPTYIEIADLGNNLTFPGSACPGTVGDPLLGLLTDNGGPTLTIAPGPGSPAIGGVPAASCSPNVDQRGEARPGPGKASCDIGAFETNEVAEPPDNTPPDTVIETGPSGPITANQVTFTFRGEPANDTAKFQCSIDSGEFVDCVSPRTFASLADGPHTFAVRAFDAAGNYDLSPASRSFSISSTPPPRARIGRVSVGGPSKVSRGDLATFRIRVANSGNTRATAVKVKGSGGGAAVTRVIGSIAAGGAETVQVPMRLTQAGGRKLTFKVTSANAGSATVTRRITVRSRS